MSFASVLKNFTSRMYMRSTVLVNAAFGSTAGILVMTDAGQPVPVRCERYTALATPTPTPIISLRRLETFQPVASLIHFAVTSSIEVGIAAAIQPPLLFGSACASPILAPVQALPTDNTPCPWS